MKKLIFTILLSLTLLNVFSAHIKGGFFTYEYLGPGAAPSSLRYKIILTVYMACGATTAQISDPINFSIYTGNFPTLYRDVSVFKTSEFPLAKFVDDPCITGAQDICYYKVVTYELSDIELPSSVDGYTVSYQRCCRIANMDNINNSGNVGNTYTIKIPGTSSSVLNANQNSSPNFPVNDTAVVCGGSFFRYPFTASDKDGDQLTYTFCSAFEGGSTSNATPATADPPPYTTVSYSAPYSGSQPMGSGVTIDSKTGMISGIAPLISNTGEFVVTVCVTETRNGQFVGQTRKELHIQVKDCVPLKALLNPKPVTCDGFAVNFSNDAVNQSGVLYDWDFGDPASGVNNTSTLPTPGHTYTDTGVYIVKLKVSTGIICADSTTLAVKVYPGFFPDFTLSGPLCKGSNIQFFDNTSTKYGKVTGWHWDFGDPLSLADTSIFQNTIYAYPDPATYNVRLIVGNTFGCIDTVYKDVIIAGNPPLTGVSGDTSYCGLDTLQLTASGPGNFNWTPGTNILNSNTATPLVFPAVPTNYIVTLNLAGCISRDTVKVTPKYDLTTSITASASNICEDDILTLTANSNYSSNLTWNWSPASTVSDSLAKVTRAFPTTNTTYTLTTFLGKHCVATASQTINVKALAIPNAGVDRSICIGQTSVQLNATGGNTYQWTPAAGLSNPNIPNPIASPAVTTDYQVTVGVTGCSKLRSDTMQVLVRALPPMTLTNDTLICSIDTLQLLASGTGNFSWSPNVNISNVSAQNPLVSPDVPVKYFATLTDAFGCKNTDSVFVDVKLFVSINAGADTAICRNDGMVLNTVSDALSYKWSPPLYLNDNTIKRPLATPLDPVITYTVIGNIGKCQSTDQVTIRTVPYPQPSAGNDTLICFGGSAQLRASGGSIYAWLPSTYLTSTSISNPVSIKPATDIKYTVTVSDVLGCPKKIDASVWVRVLPLIIADAGPRDTSVVIGQPLLLNGTGGTTYQWSPSLWLSNPGIANPVALPEDNIQYILTASNAAGCQNKDSIRVKVFKVPPDLYVPTGFSPNGDANNDVLRPILLGMRSLKYFRVFNRWGQLIFSTSQKDRGWDGTLKGNPQEPGTYVWMAEGETFTGKVITKKGTTVLLR